MVLGPEIFMYKLLFNKACNDYTDGQVEGLRKKLAGQEEEVDMVEELLHYLDGELPRADQEDVERVLDRAAPVLAALLVPMKKKYDKIIEIKEEVTEKITEVVPVEEIVQDYEDTLEDLRGFCKHISEEVGTNWNDNMDELHRKLWELETSSVISETDNFSLSSLENSAPGIGGLRLRRHIDQELGSPEMRLPLSLMVREEEENENEDQESDWDNQITPKATNHTKHRLEKRSTIPDFLASESTHSIPEFIQQQHSNTNRFPDFLALENPPIFQNNNNNNPMSHPERKLVKRSTIPDFLASEFGTHLDPRVTPPERFMSPLPRTSISIVLQPDITVSSTSPPSSPLQTLLSQPSNLSLGAAGPDRAQSPYSFYSPCHSRRHSLTTSLTSDVIISRYVSRESSRRASLQGPRESWSPHHLYDLSNCDAMSSASYSDQRSRTGLSQRQNALSLLVDYVRFKIGNEKLSAEQRNQNEASSSN